MAILALDQATVSGWAIIDNHSLVMSGEARTVQERHSACSIYAWNTDRDDPPVVVLEDHVFGPKRATHALHQVRGRWLENLELVYGEPPEVHALSPAEWRRLHGAPRWFGSPVDRRKQAKAWAINTCKDARFGSNLTDNEAEAILIGLAFFIKRDTMGEWGGGKPSGRRQSSKRKRRK